MQQQQQEPTGDDLVLVFPDEEKATTAIKKILGMGIAEGEIRQTTLSNINRSGVFRVNGPGDEKHRNYFLQKERSGPNPVLVVVFALIFALILGGLTFVSTFALPNLHVGYVFLIGAAIGLVLGAILGLLRRGRVRGDIGQKTTAPPTPQQIQSARNVLALNFADPDNTVLVSRVRATGLNNGGKIYHRPTSKRQE